MAASYSNVALIEKDPGELTAARELMQRPYNIRLSRLGSEHPATKKCVDWLAEIQGQSRATAIANGSIAL